MTKATFEFQGNLNDFLPFAHRHREIECLCAESATAKHMVEALGVPHTEVGAITVNGEESSLQYLLQEKDHVVVHPLSYPVRVSVQMRHALPTFLADAHLGGLARLMRMAGLDTLYDNAIRDDDLVRVAMEEHRIILSRDRELLKRRTVVSGCYIRSLKPAEQMAEATERFDLARYMRPFTLCLHCNLPLAPVDKASVHDKLPPSVRALHTEFSGCPCCQRIYWKGSHWQRMQALLQSILAKAAQNRSATDRDCGQAPP